MSDSLIGKQVIVEFDTSKWPAYKGYYTYEGHDENGYWLRRKDGVQRYMPRDVVVGIVPDE